MGCSALAEAFVPPWRDEIKKFTLVNDCFKNESNAVFAHFLRRLVKGNINWLPFLKIKKRQLPYLEIALPIVSKRTHIVALCFLTTIG